VSTAAAMSSKVAGHPPPPPVRRYSGRHTVKPASARPTASGPACVRSQAARQNPPCRNITTPAARAAPAALPALAAPGRGHHTLAT
jgi:hypothetical protein